jgi:FMN phosphatase YigB (HAD superfamily)
MSRKITVPTFWVRSVFFLVPAFFFIASATGTHIIFDLNGVLINSNYEQALEQFGLTKMDFLWYMLSTRNNPRTRLFQLFDTIKPRDPQEISACDEQGRLLPQLMLDWQRGTMPAETIRDHLLEYCQSNPELMHSPLEKKIFTRMIATMFTPEKFAALQVWNPEALTLVHECKQQGHAVYILSNWDAGTLDVMYANPYFKNVFDLFDGIVISGKVHAIKPDPSIYQYLLKTYTLDPAQCIFIDDQLVNVRAARTVGIFSIWCRPVRSLLRPWTTHPDFSYVRTKLTAQERMACAGTSR